MSRLSVLKVFRRMKAILWILWISSQWCSRQVPQVGAFAVLNNRMTCLLKLFGSFKVELRQCLTSFGK